MASTGRVDDAIDSPGSHHAGEEDDHESIADGEFDYAFDHSGQGSVFSGRFQFTALTLALSQREREQVELFLF